MKYVEKQNEIINQSETIEKKLINILATKDKKFLQEIKDDWFLNERLKKIFSILRKSKVSGESPEPEILKNKLGTLYAECLSDNYILSGQIEKIVNQKKELWLKYKVNEIISRYGENDIDKVHETISSIWSDLNKILEGHEIEDVGFDYIYKLYKKEEDEYHAKENIDDLIGYRTGFNIADKNIDGLRNGHLWILGGYTSTGKTQAILNIAKNLMEQEVPVSFYSLEMNKVDIFKRLIGIISGKPSSLLLKKKDLDEITLKQKEEAIEKIKNSGIRIHTEKMNLDEILMSMTIENMSGVAKVFIIDYAQLIQVGNENEYESMTMVANKLQSFCVKNNVPIILVSQVSNESARNNTHMIGFKGSGALGASADLTIELINGEEDYNERDRKIADGEPIIVKMVAKKNRHGRIFNTDVYFDTVTGRFFNEDPSF